MTKQKITDVTGVENCNARVVKYNVRFMHDASQQKRSLRAGLYQPVLSAITMCIFLWKNKNIHFHEIFDINNQESTSSHDQ